MSNKLYPDIAALLPHNAPLILLDNVVEHSAKHICCEVTITPDSFLYEPQHSSVPAQVGIEYMAQTIAALGGIEASDEGQKPPIGFLLGARRYQHQGGPFAEGMTYLITANELVRDDNMAVYQCDIVDVNGNVMSTGQVNTVVASDEMLAELSKKN